MEKGIIPIVMGGLGNQMFIVASAFVVSKTNHYTLYLFKNTLDNNQHNIHQIDYNLTIFKEFGIHISDNFRNIKNIDAFKDYNHHSIQINNNAFDEWNPLEVKKGTLMNRYYQYYPTISVFENEIRNLFLTGLYEFINRFQISVDTSAFLHVRRGDYLSLSEIHFIQPLSYYQQCVNELLQRNKHISKIYILSDDSTWVKSQTYFQENIFDIQENLNELESMALMSQCKGGAICANSTFSWWGAFLGAYKERNPVFIPKKWINIDSVIDLFPPEWIQI
jgi:hypothetical protein